jgi:hypothetical protein
MYFKKKRKIFKQKFPKFSLKKIFNIAQFTGLTKICESYKIKTLCFSRKK